MSIKGMILVLVAGASLNASAQCRLTVNVDGMDWAQVKAMGNHLVEKFGEPTKSETSTRLKNFFPEATFRNHDEDGSLRTQQEAVLKKYRASKDVVMSTQENGAPSALLPRLEMKFNMKTTSEGLAAFQYISDLHEQLDTDELWITMDLASKCVTKN